MKHSNPCIPALIGAALLSACGSGSSTEGIEATIKATAVGTPEHHHDETPSAGARHFRRQDGLRIELETGLIKLVPIQLQACASTAALQWLQQFNPLGAAWAHGGGTGTTPEGAFSVLDAPGSVVDLGTLGAAPGRYCGLVVELQPGADAGSALAAVAPCYYPDTIGLTDSEAAVVETHECIEARPLGTAQRLTVPFTEAISLDAAQRTLEATLSVRYENWFDNIDMSQLADAAPGSLAQQQRLIDNIKRSLSLHTGTQQAVTVAFKTLVNGAETKCGSVHADVGNGVQRDFELRDFRFYIADLQLRGSAGSAAVQLARSDDDTIYQDASHSVALLGHATGCDATVASRREVRLLHGAAAAGSYDQLCFKLGVPFELNHLDTATSASPLNVTAMAWSWLSGHKFLRIDGVGDADGARQNFFVHLGSTGCTNGTGENGKPPAGACAQPNLAEICLDYAEIAAGHAVHVDAGAILAEVDIATNTAMTAPGCMSGTTDPECLTILPKLGLDYSYNGQIIPAQPQALFGIGE